MVARDHHCAFPGCTRPPVMGHAHHIRHWADGGTTSLENLVLLCGHHHRTVHHTPWQVRLSPDDRQPEFLPPPRHAHPPPVWIRHRARLE
ncbi:HNH endonuclease signature motif containing protein [Nocardioides coralli]|uniref:HNH endonuclease signature motif containing protein n=1 Tax=Nocardioides coralli TaxID=2872154 RepID=UPI0024B5C04D|nr:HNH endonuclease signature motif containing protein [Nocardioides coralli]